LCELYFIVYSSLDSLREQYVFNLLNILALKEKFL